VTVCPGKEDFVFGMFDSPHFEDGFLKGVTETDGPVVDRWVHYLPCTFRPQPERGLPRVQAKDGANVGPAYSLPAQSVPRLGPRRMIPQQGRPVESRISECFEVSVICHKLECMSNHRQEAFHRLNNAIDSVESVPCQDLPEVFFPDDFLTKDMKEQAAQMAQKLCATCPARFECFEYAMVAKERFGVWGGTLPSDR